MNSIDWDNAPTHPEFEVVWLEVMEEPSDDGWHVHLPAQEYGLPERYEEWGDKEYWTVDGPTSDNLYYKVHRNSEYTKPITSYEALRAAVLTYKLHPTTGNQHKMFDLLENTND